MKTCLSRSSFLTTLPGPPWELLLLTILARLQQGAKTVPSIKAISQREAAFFPGGDVNIQGWFSLLGWISKALTFVLCFLQLEGVHGALVSSTDPLGWEQW